MNLQAIVRSYASFPRYIESHSMTIWQKFVDGVNMSSVNCFEPKLNEFKKFEDKFSLMAFKDDIEYFEIDDNSGYHLNLVAPLLIELGRRVNRSLHLFLNDCKEKSSLKSGANFHYQLLRTDYLTSMDRVPFKYNHEINRGFNCSKPLYLSNQMVILSPDIRKQKYPMEHIFLTYDMRIWTLIIVSFGLVLVINWLSNRLNSGNNKLGNFSHAFWAHFWPLIGKAHELGYRGFLYILWVTSLLPLTEIVKNDLLANLLTEELIPLETIDHIFELYDKKIITRIYTDSFKAIDYKHYSSINIVGEKEFRDKVDKLLQLFIEINKDIMDLVPFLDDPKQMVKIISSSVLIEDEEWVEIVLPFLSRIVSGHRGEAYIPFLITSLCYGHNFQFVSEVESLSKRLFETSILQHWYKQKYVFIFEQAAIIFEKNPFFGSRPVSDYYQSSTDWSQLYFTQTNSLFVFILYSSIMTFVGFIGEWMWYHYFYAFKWDRF